MTNYWKTDPFTVMFIAVCVIGALVVLLGGGS